MNYRKAIKSDLAHIAAAHIFPSKAKFARAMQSSEYMFYRDKVDLFYKVEKEGIIVAEEDGVIAGFVIVLSSVKRLKRLFFTKGYIVKWAFNAICGRYVFRSMLNRLLINLIPFFNSLRRRFSAHEDASESNLNADARIWSIIVLEEFQGQGIATELLKLAFEYLESRKVEEVMVMVHQDNIPAIRLYEKLGFAKISRGEVFLMTKKLVHKRGKFRCESKLCKIYKIS